MAPNPRLWLSCLGWITCVACGSPRTEAPPPSGSGILSVNGRESPARADFAPGACEPGDTRQCTETLGRHNGVLSCFVGVQHCEDGSFGPCQDGVLETVSVTLPSEASDLSLSSLSMPSECVNNPCNPFCQEYVEIAYYDRRRTLVASERY
jgi:hypothetical protein